MAAAAAGIGATSALAATRRHDKLNAVRDILIPERRKTLRRRCTTRCLLVASFLRCCCSIRHSYFSILKFVQSRCDSNVRVITSRAFFTALVTTKTVFHWRQAPPISHSVFDWLDFVFGYKSSPIYGVLPTVLRCYLLNTRTACARTRKGLVVQATVLHACYDACLPLSQHLN